MLRCLTTEKKSVYSTSCNEVETRALSRAGGLLCPSCESRVTFKKGAVKIAHFSHRRDAECAFNSYEPETNTHLKGKDIIYRWLKSSFPNAIVELEYFVNETKQIADVFISHQTGNFSGQKWAFEFQHSPLTVDAWRLRHDQYKSAGITDFWFLDTDKFLKFSRAQGMDDARVRNSLELEIYDVTGLCYFLDTDSKEITIDCSFYQDYELYNGRHKTWYTYHTPAEHSCKLDDTSFLFNSEFSICGLNFDAVNEKVKERLELQVTKAKRELERRLEEELQIKATEKKEYSSQLYGKDNDYVWSILKTNKLQVKEDVRNLSNEHFFEKYSSLLNKALLIKAEKETWRDSEVVELNLLHRLSIIDDIKHIDTIEQIDRTSLLEFTKSKYAKDLTLINYALNKYTDILVKISNYNQKMVYKDLERISYKISVYPSSTKRTTYLDYAENFKRCADTNEIDELVTQIINKVINFNPFS
jgi:competence protein CoiA